MEGKGVPIPIERDRIGVLIGKDGRTKRRAEEEFGVKLKVDSENAVVYVEEGEKPLTPLLIMKIKNFIRAISIGFAPEDALRLSDDSTMLEVIDLKEIAKHRQDMKRIKGRIIGEEGKAKRMIEDLTGTKVVVGEKEVGIIGDYEGVSAAREAIMMLIAGRTHRTVYNFLRVKSREIKRRRLEIWERWRM